MAFDKFFKKIGISQGETEEEDSLEELQGSQQPVKEPKPAAPTPTDTPQSSAGIAETLGNTSNRGSKVVDISSTGASIREKTYTGPHSVKEAAANMKVVVIQPRSLDDSQQIANCLKEKRPVVINFEGVDDQLYRRILDFVSGTTYALDGNINDISTRVWLFSPKNVDVSVNKQNNTSFADMPWEKK